MTVPQFDFTAQVRTFGADSLLPPVKPSLAQIEGLKRIRDLGPSGWCSGYSRAGGAIARMFGKMVKEGWLDGPPYQLTDKGRAILERSP